MSLSRKSRAVNLAEATVLVTGATDGVGKIVATQLAASGAKLLLHGRSEDKGMNTVREIQRATGNSRVEYQRADLASLNEVRQLADTITAKHDRLHVLINNAGVGFGPSAGSRETSRDGYELRFAVNYLAPFLLTNLLLSTVRRSAPSRIVNVASIGQSPIDFAGVMLTGGYDGRRAYGQSKLALIMFTFDLAERLQGTGVTANAIHPATLMNTKMVAEAGMEPQSSVKEGAEAIIHLATSPELEGTSGEFFNGRHPFLAIREAYDTRQRRQLANISIEWTKPPAHTGE